MERHTFRRYWKYYLHLEQLLMNTFDFVALAKENFGAYSNQYASILQLTGAELDAFFKAFFNVKNGNIKIYIRRLVNEYPLLSQQKVDVWDSNIVLMPFEKCNDVLLNHPIKWWKAFTGIKHDRINNFSQANLGNCLQILAALYILEFQCIRKIAEIDQSIGIPIPESKLFILESCSSRYQALSDNLVLECK